MWGALCASGVAERGDAPVGGGWRDARLCAIGKGCRLRRSYSVIAADTAAQQPSPTLRVPYLAHRATSLPPGIFTFQP